MGLRSLDFVLEDGCFVGLTREESSILYKPEM